VPVFQLLTSWTREDLTSPLNGINLKSGALFDRLEHAVREDPSPWKRHAAICAHLKVRNMPARPPPRVLVFTGPAGAAKRQVMAGLVKMLPACFARVVTHTTRLPKEHEVDGVDYHFTDAQALRCGTRFLGCCTSMLMQSRVCCRVMFGLIKPHACRASLRRQSGCPVHCWPHALLPDRLGHACMYPSH
jgi:hypothetical protein